MAAGSCKKTSPVSGSVTVHNFTLPTAPLALALLMGRRAAPWLTAKRYQQTHSGAKNRSCYWTKLSESS